MRARLRALTIALAVVILSAVSGLFTSSMATAAPVAEASLSPGEAEAPASPTPPDPTPPSPEPVVTTETFESTESIDIPAPRRAGDVSTFAPGDTPPLGGCNWQPALTVTATYVNSVIADARADYTGNLACVTTAAGQTMDELTMTIASFKDFNFRKGSDLIQCSNVVQSDPPCVGLQDSDQTFCSSITGENCSGNWTSNVTVTLLLPEGWVFSTPDEDCQFLDGEGRELLCTTFTGPAFVPPTI